MYLDFYSNKNFQEQKWCLHACNTQSGYALNHRYYLKWDLTRAQNLRIRCSQTNLFGSTTRRVTEGCLDSWLFQRKYLQREVSHSYSSLATSSEASISWHLCRYDFPTLHIVALKYCRHTNQTSETPCQQNLCQWTVISSIGLLDVRYTQVRIHLRIFSHW